MNFCEYLHGFKYQFHTLNYDNEKLSFEFYEKKNRDHKNLIPFCISQ